MQASLNDRSHEGMIAEQARAKPNKDRVLIEQEDSILTEGAARDVTTRPSFRSAWSPEMSRQSVRLTVIAVGLIYSLSARPAAVTAAITVIFE